MPEEYGALGLTIPVLTDAPDVPKAFRDLADSIDATQWVSDALKPSAGRKAANAAIASLATSEVWSDVGLAGGNLSVAPSVPSTLLVTATFEIKVAATSELSVDAAVQGTLSVDGVEQPQVALFIPAQMKAGSLVSFLSQVVTQTYAVPLAAGTHVIKQRVRKLSGSSPVTVAKEGTGFSYQLFAA